MTDIFISYARDDRARVEPLVRVLEDQGYSVWWDRELVPGSSFEKVIDDAITKARCVLVVWTTRSVHSEWVQAEAGDGLERGILVPVMMDAVRVPISFRRKHAASLQEWPTRSEPREIEFLLRGIAECVGRTPEPANEAPSSHMPYPIDDAVSPIKWTRLITAASLGLLLAAAFVIYQLVLAPSATREPKVTDYSIAVLPFIDPEEVVTTTAEVRARSGIAYELARALSRISTLKVVSNEAVAGMLGEADIAQIRRRLEVNYLIEGEASRDALAISLVNTLRGKTLWTENFDATRDPLFEAVGAITRRVARTLELPLPQGFPEQRVPEAAYLAYLKGRAELRKPGTEHARTAAREFFDDAIAIAPQFGEAYAGLCEAHINDYVATASASDFESAERYCHRALTLDPGNHEVHIALGSLLRSSGQYERALESYRTVLAAAPYNVEALRGMGDTYAEMGLAEKAEQQYKLLIEIEPGFWANYQNLGNLYFNIGRFTEAAENYEIQASLVRDRTRVINNLAAAHFLAEDFDRAVDAWKRALEIEPEAVTYANVGSAQFFLEKFAESAEMYEQAILISPEDHRTWGSAAEAYYYDGGDERNREYFEKAIALAEGQLAINPNDYSTLSTVARYHSYLGHADEALDALAKAQALNDEDVYLAYDAAVVYARLNRPQDAERAIEKLLELGYSKRLIAMDANFRDYKHVLDKEEP